MERDNTSETDEHSEQQHDDVEPEKEGEEETETFEVKQRSLDGGKPEGQTTLSGDISKPKKGERDD